MIDEFHTIDVFLECQHGSIDTPAGLVYAIKGLLYNNLTCNENRKNLLTAMAVVDRVKRELEEQLAALEESNDKEI